MRRRSRVRIAFASIATVSAVVIAGCGGSDSSDDAEGPITVYSGREEELVGPLFKQFQDETGIELDIRYGNSPELATQIGEEGSNSPADVFVAQDAGSLGSVQDRFSAIPQDSLDRVDEQFRGTDGRWVGLSGRVRVVAFDSAKHTASDLPDTVAEYAKPAYAPKLGVAPTNGSFVAFISGMRIQEGDDAAKTFLADLKKNGAKTFDGNRVIVETIANGDIEFGLVNHYYLGVVKSENPDITVENKYMKAGDPGGLVNVTGVGILDSSDQKASAERFVEFLLSDEGQAFYTKQAEAEYPLAEGVPAAEGLPALDTLLGGNVPLTDLAEKAESSAQMISDAGLGE